MRRLYAFNPWVKMVVLLREPTSRTYSAGVMNAFKGAFHLTPAEVISLLILVPVNTLIVYIVKKRNTSEQGDIDISQKR